MQAGASPSSSPLACFIDQFFIDLMPAVVELVCLLKYILKMHQVNYFNCLLRELNT